MPDLKKYRTALPWIIGLAVFFIATIVLPRTAFVYVVAAAAVGGVAAVAYMNFKNRREGDDRRLPLTTATAWILGLANFFIPGFGAPYHSMYEVKGMAVGLVFLLFTGYATDREGRFLRAACVIANIALFICFLSVYPLKP